MIGKEVPASARELALLDDLRTACAAGDRPRIDAFMRQIRAVQKARLYEMTTIQREDNTPCRR